MCLKQWKYWVSWSSSFWIDIFLSHRNRKQAGLSFAFIFTQLTLKWSKTIDVLADLSPGQIKKESREKGKPTFVLSNLLKAPINPQWSHRTHDDWTECRQGMIWNWWFRYCWRRTDPVRTLMWAIKFSSRNTENSRWFWLMLFAAISWRGV